MDAKAIAELCASHGIDPASFVNDPKGTGNKLVELYKLAVGKAKEASAAAKQKALDDWENSASIDEEAIALAETFKDNVWREMADLWDNPHALQLATEHIRSASKALTAERDHNRLLFLTNLAPKVEIDKKDTTVIKNGIVALQALGYTVPEVTVKDKDGKPKLVSLFVAYKLRDTDKPTAKASRVNTKRDVYIWKGHALPPGTTTNQVAHDYVSDVPNRYVVRWIDIIKLLNAKYHGHKNVDKVTVPCPKGAKCEHVKNGIDIWQGTHWTIELKTGLLEGLPGSMASKSESDASDEEE